ncbi:MAG: hypothetical protein QM728_13895 [Gordonia sp. (in: high G+C Gram-positive bacteria)]|uniref:hypothetical protein n=1 Tax=Gordonia sp. (in: high G+C Gram-positive bacteria) TaxID=84139 RepID=UPI0039E37674
MRPFTRIVAAGALSAATVVGTTSLAPDADARVSEGRYRAVTSVFGMTFRTYVAVNGHTLYDFGPLGAQRSRIVSTRTGGFYDAYGQRRVLNRRPGGGFSGPVFVGPVVVGHSELRPTSH